MTGLSRRRLAQASAFGAGILFMPHIARAQAKTIKIGILSDMSGTYSEATGQGDVITAKFASRTSPSSILISASRSSQGTCC